jgi:nucleoside-diphosphate-sugar epimerase
MNVLVLGGAGYIGSVLIPSLLDTDIKSVTVVDNFIYGQNSLSHCCHHPKFDVYKADARNWSAIKDHVSRADVIFPLAALVGAPLCDQNPIDAKLINLDHPLQMFKSLSRDQRVVMPTTESAYGANDSGECTEGTPINPLSTYAKDKAVVEAALLQRENSVSLRFATVFGMSPRMRLDLLINDFVWKAAKEGTIVIYEGHFKRTCLHVRDAVSALQYAMNNLADGMYNVVSFSASKLEICEAINRQKKFNYVEMDSGSDPDQRNYSVSSKKLLKFGFEFRFDLHLGIAELLKGYKMLKNTRYGNV